MQTLRQVVSDLSSDVRARNLDDRYSFRYLASKFRDKVGYFLRLEARSREILKEPGVWKPIECIELEDVAVTACGDVGGCNNLKRSKIQIPEPYKTNYGITFKLLTIDGLSEFRVIQSFQYKDYANREYYNNSLPPYWIENKYIYIPNTTIEAVKALIIPKDPLEVDKLNGSCNDCASPLDGEVNYPDYIITLAKKEVLNELLAGKGIVQDEKPDDNTNKKN